MDNKISSSQQPEREHRQKGQAIVLIAAAMIGLLAFVGIAVDVGFVFARNSQLQAAVDAAALAGVTELTANDISAADDKAERFLNSNNIPITDTATMVSTSYNTELQETAYGITVTWPVDLFFLKVIGWDQVTLEKSATAAFFPLTDMAASRQILDSRGVVNISNQAIYGPFACTSYGDPYSPTNSPHRPSGYGSGLYTYRYRIQIPESYGHDEVRVEIFDPDSHNESGNTITVERTDTAVNSGGLSATEDLTCADDSQFVDAHLQQNACLIQTGEETLFATDTTFEPYDDALKTYNPFWFVRVDKNRPPTGSCDQTPGSYSAGNNTTTSFELSYYEQNADGTVQQIPLTGYTGLTDNSQDTDLRWVSPGAPQSFDQPTFVPITYDFTPSQDGFEIHLTDDTPNIMEDAEGNRHLYLEVTTTGGSSQNGFELWAGPSVYVNNVRSHVNHRNLDILNRVNGANTHDSDGVAVYAVGTLPLNWNTSDPAYLPLLYNSESVADSTLYIRYFDIDNDSDVAEAPTMPLLFNYDTLYFNPAIPEGDWHKSFSDSGTDPDGHQASSRCLASGSLCNDVWLNPSYEIVVPGEGETHFAGGNLMVYYDGGAGDNFTWEVDLAGPPYLVK